METTTETKTELSNYDYTIKRVKQSHELIRKCHIDHSYFDKERLKLIGQYVYDINYFHTNTVYPSDEKKKETEELIVNLQKDITELSKCFGMN